MPPPAWGKGNAFASPSCSDRFVGDAREAALAHEDRQCKLDTEREAMILRLVTGSKLQQARRSTACAETRVALRCCRRGVDPETDPKVGVCELCKGKGRVHAFLCKTRVRDVRESSEEKLVVTAVKHELGVYLQECRTALKAAQVCCVHGPIPRPSHLPPAFNRPTVCRTSPCRTSRCPRQRLYGMLYGMMARLLQPQHSCTPSYFAALTVTK